VIKFGELAGGELFILRRKELAGDVSWNTKLKPEQKFYSPGFCEGDEPQEINAIDYYGNGLFVEDDELVQVTEEPLTFGDLFEGEHFTYYNRGDSIFGSNTFIKVGYCKYYKDEKDEGSEFNSVNICAPTDSCKKRMFFKDDMKVVVK
jgi:hypothetical protein